MDKIILEIDFKRFNQKYIASRCIITFAIYINFIEALKLHQIFS